jgi:hypothetical protein
MSSNFKKVLDAPLKSNTLPKNAKWLSGEGCGSWFCIEIQNSNYKISRFSPEGKLECEGFFIQTEGSPFNINKEFTFTYLSHCALISINQNDTVKTFKRL